MSIALSRRGHGAWPPTRHHQTAPRCGPTTRPRSSGCSLRNAVRRPATRKCAPSLSERIALQPLHARIHAHRDGEGKQRPPDHVWSVQRRQMTTHPKSAPRGRRHEHNCRPHAGKAHQTACACGQGSSTWLRAARAHALAAQASAAHRSSRWHTRAPRPAAGATRRASAASKPPLHPALLTGARVTTCEFRRWWRQGSGRVAGSRVAQACCTTLRMRRCCMRGSTGMSVIEWTHAGFSARRAGTAHLWRRRACRTRFESSTW